MECFQRFAGRNEATPRHRAGLVEKAGAEPGDDGWYDWLARARSRMGL